MDAVIEYYAKTFFYGFIPTLISGVIIGKLLRK
ncbi:hypothetical protein EDF66_101364 [Sphingobacterium sp. JUb20]|nr:hypothetical protein [Sphingobacterium sp. JUb21]TCR10550.1 hypothetical protein EDF66_101364 [Sphingobacterium sp. JUb20]